MPPRHRSAFLTLTSQSAAIPIGHLMLQQQAARSRPWQVIDLFSGVDFTTWAARRRFWSAGQSPRQSGGGPHVSTNLHCSFFGGGATFALGYWLGIQRSFAASI